MAVVAASVASSFLVFAIVVALGLLSPTSSHSWTADPNMILATAAIVTLWGPVAALIPAAILGWFIERPKARKMIARSEGLFIWHVALSVAAAATLSLLLRVALHLFDPKYPLLDVFSLVLFALIGLCSGISWWFLVVVPGRRT